jgi:DmsE family decaheme c-type cytochrome
VTAQEASLFLDYAGSGSATCLKCHEDTATKNVFHTKHGVGADGRTPMGMFQCESCHGGARLHVEAPEKFPAPPMTFRKQVGGERAQNAICLQCHDNHPRADWNLSAHERAGVRCVDCHTVHRDDDPMLHPAQQAEHCESCHRSQRADLHKPSAHPMAEGKMSCSDCHAVHGSKSDRLLKGVSTNQTCYACHADKRGPFLWEHAPAREDCTVCHVAHGSMNPSLLRTRTPFLCQQCHSMASHPSTNLDASSLTPGDYRNRFVLAKGCMNCHGQVHGSNHPSGVKLTR